MVILDSSAILAVLFGEPGHETVDRNLGSAAVCAVNVTEVITRLIDDSGAVDDALARLAALGLAVMPFDERLSLRAGALRGSTRNRGLSLGDRACLALAEREHVPVLTADRAWAGLAIGIDIRLIR